MTNHPHNYPEAAQAVWPGLVGKGDGGEPPIELDTMLDLTAAAEVDGVRFDGFDMFLYHPHVDIDGGEDEIQRLADKARSREPRWSARSWRRSMPAPAAARRMGNDADRRVPRPGPQRRAASPSGCANWACGPRRQGPHRFGLRRSRPGAKTRSGTRSASPKPSARPAASPKTTASDWPPKGKSAGAACTVGNEWSNCWRWSIARKRSASRPTWRIRCLYLLGYNAPEDALLPQDFDWGDRERFDEAYRTLTAALRPWTIDFHVAQNDGTVHGSGSHDKTGRHCLPNDPNGKLDIPRHAGYWLRDESGQLTKRFRPHLLGRLHVPQRRDDASRRPGTTSSAQ